MTEIGMTVQEASARLGLKPGSVRKAYRKGHITGKRLGHRESWSFLLLDRASVERYARVYRGKVGAAKRRCLECGVTEPKHGGDHTFVRDPRLEAVPA